MLYTFKSPATANLLMLEKNGAQLLTIIGKELTPQGIITVAQIPDAIAALEAEVAGHITVAQIPDAIAALEAEVAGQEAAQGQPEDGPAAGQGEEVDYVSLSQRVTPFIEMLQRSEDAGEAVVWGV